MGFLMHDDRGRAVRRHRRALVEQPAVLVGGLLRDLRGDQHRRASRPRCDSRSSSTSSRSAILAFFFIAALVSGKFDTDLLDQHRDAEDPDGGGPFLPFGISGIFQAIPFAIWFYLAIEELPLAAEESRTRSGTSPRATIWGMTPWSIAGVLTLFLNTGVAGARRRSATSATPLFDGFKAIFGDGHRGGAAGPDRADGPDRQLLHDHLRVRPEHLLAVAGRLLPEVAVGDARDAQDAARRADRRRGRRLRRSRGSSTSSAGEASGGQIVAALLNMAVFGAVISYAMQCLSFILLRRKHAEHRPAVPEPSGVWRCGDRRRHRGGLAVSLFRTTTTGPGCTGWPSTSCSASSTSRSPDGTAWCSHPRRSSR